MTTDSQPRIPHQSDARQSDARQSDARQSDARQSDARQSDADSQHRAVIDQFLVHLGREAETLAKACQTLEEVQQAIVSRSREDLSPRVERQAALSAEVVQASQARQQLRATLGQALGIPPESVTVSRLIQLAAPDQTEQLRAQAQHLAVLARRVEQLTYQNALLAQQQVDLFQRLLSCLTGKESSAPRYQANGEAEPDSSCSVIEVRC